MPGTDLTARMFRFVRKQKGLSIRLMAAELGVHRSSLSRIEAGKTYPPDVALQQLLRCCAGSPELTYSCLRSLIFTMVACECREHSHSG